MLQRHERPAQTQAGFTLIELLISISLMAVLAVMSWRGLDGMMRTQDITQTRVNQVAVVQTALAQWRADLDAVQPVAGVSNSGVMWDGRVLRVIRRASHWQAQGEDPGLWVVGWTRRTALGSTEGTGQWVRWQSRATSDLNELKKAWAQAERWGQNRSEDDAPFETAALPLLQWQLTYFRGNAWVHPLSSSEGKANEINSDMPDAIRLQIDLPSSTGLNGRLTLDWVRPDFSNTKS